MSHEETHVEEPAEETDILKVFEQRVTAKSVKAVRQFDPSWILTLLNVLAQLFQNCPKPPTPAQIRRRPLMMRARLHTELKREFPDVKRKGIGDMVEDVFDVACEAEDGEIKKFCAACK